MKIAGCRENDKIIRGIERKWGINCRSKEIGSQGDIHVLLWPSQRASSRAGSTRLDCQASQNGRLEFDSKSRRAEPAALSGKHAARPTASNYLASPVSVSHTPPPPHKNARLRSPLGDASLRPIRRLRRRRRRRLTGNPRNPPRFWWGGVGRDQDNST
ncbi:hypothetical protein GUJ93_ZPchr0008g13137 [Zizania palustris]|uniref:Uncharacterized protein n=1 Tax=Zizania palustris TaxID=103762 RepID=A0A8J5RU60_ZIZPA|nr:hypothetical protein GUJ93_ZPchr0008g13137 [Zizania palustris]